MDIRIATFVALPLLYVTAQAQDVPTAAQLYKRTLPSIMTLNVETAVGRSQGTAFMALADGIAVTALHVVEGAIKVSARFSNGETFEVSGLVDKDEKHDIALIRVKVANRPLLRFSIKNPEIGSKAYVIGAPEGLEFSISDGIISQMRTIERIKFVQYTCPTSHGNSGGPLMDDAGLVIGVVDLTNAQGQNLNFASPAKYAANLDSSLPTEPWAALKAPSPDNEADKATPPAVPSPKITKEAEVAKELLAIRLSFWLQTFATEDFAFEALSGRNMQLPDTVGEAARELPKLKSRLRSVSSANPDISEAIQNSIDQIDGYSVCFDELQMTALGVRKNGWDEVNRALLERATGHLVKGDPWRALDAWLIRAVAVEDVKKFNPEQMLMMLDYDQEAFPIVARLGIRLDPRRLPSLILLAPVDSNGKLVKSRFRRGDQLVQLDGVALSGCASLEAEFEKGEGKTVRLAYVREGETHEAKVRIKKAPKK